MIYVHFADGFEEIEALSIVDILRRAGEDVQMVSIMGRKNVTATHGVEVVCDILFEEADYENCEMIVFPGGMPGVTYLDEHEGLGAVILDFAAKGKLIGAICAAPVILYHKGLLEGKNIICFPDFAGKIKGANIDTSGVLALRDGNIITSRGPATAMAFALELVKALQGEEAAATVAARL
ncbi:MAG: DJ-1/PfpI family protein [Clostridiales Family XIII bacterium]|jgi:4-methyl-5(b-hydroxyethyl)-thiazole monophosphate biosynthesis|nr:DJ-1/PfpI family protein [Clostridiales Family XIII bacterium]